jgi:plasmid stabilization system protein ParE
MVGEEKTKVVWSHQAKTELRLAWEFISLTSPEYARKLVHDITATTNGLLENPTRYPPDRFRIGNHGDFRAFEIHQYRIAYQITKAQIKILRLRHVRQKPLEY